MTAYTLTIGNDNFPGTADADTFSGPGGGADTLNGAGGDDTFTIHGWSGMAGQPQQGSIDGGTGTDTVVPLEGYIHTLLAFSNVEVLDLTNRSGFSAEPTQLEAFSTILLDTSLTEFSFYIGGLNIVLPGEGTVDYWGLDFSRLLPSQISLKVTAASAGQIVGTNNADELHGGATLDYTNLPPPHAPLFYGCSLYGGGGNDRLFGSGDLNGGIGDDYLQGSGSLDGGAGIDRLIGSGRLDGGAGADHMEGRGGGNEFVVDNVGDLVVAGAEGSRGEHNQISAWISIDLRNTTHYQGVIRSVSLLEGGNLNITGNALENVLRGNSGNNILNGGAGRDNLEGRAGNDTYYVDNPGDRIIELKNGGKDTVLAIGSYVLSASNVERLWAASQAGTAAMNLYGNNIPNHLLGNAGKNILDGRGDGDLISGLGGNDTLYGKEGNDVLIGGQGDDVFVFNTSRHPTANVDRILDFTNAAGNNDYFALDDAFFGRLPAGTLAASRFYAGASAHDLDDRIIYNRTTGDLFFDADGNKAGGLAAMKFAHVDNHAQLTNTDFVVF